MIRSRLCDLLGIKYPVIQGAMAWVSTAELVAAVSEAGGIGVIGAGLMPADLMREQIRKAKSLTSKPFGVNLMLLSEHIDQLVEVVLDEGVPLVTTGAGNPGIYLERFKAKGIKVFPVVPSVALAKRLERQGVDGLIAEGMESGGHIGESTTMALVPQIVDAVEIPVVAAGGIGDGRGIAAALALGADGVQMGTRFIVANECIVHEDYKTAVLKAGDRDTVVTGRPTGHPVRILKNRLAKELLRMEAEGATPEEFERVGTGKLRAAAVDGDVDFGSVMAGQIAGLVNKRQSAAEIMEEIMQDAETTLRNIYGRVH
ncbi:MAG: enoyl-[acyl-carrier-protein] reductase FabK [Nitrospirota bacterium]|nr:enoyl-[acyl-carrier-protein] reductase FabK [Nitrospirota bacterium]